MFGIGILQILYAAFSISFTLARSCQRTSKSRGEVARKVWFVDSYSVTSAQLRTSFRLIDAPSLTLRHSSQHGFYLHIGKIKRDDSVISQSSEVISVAKSKSTRVYLHTVGFQDC